ncbi:MAG: protein kinase [Gemmatimonadales bacterium]
MQLDQLRASLADRYRIEEPVGEGAMAVVFRAWDLRHERPVALKVLRSELREHIGTERFLREVQVAARLQHPHIVPLFDSGSAGGHVYYVMPFLSGETLRARLDRDGPLAIDEAVGIALQVAEALGHAHRQGVIHRDVKPENILMQEGNALVADFGVAFAVTADARLTVTGLTVGTPAYMSPEQATGAPVDGRSDLYSLAAVLYEMLTDELPHAGRSAAETVARKLTEAPRSVRDLRRNAPHTVVDAVARALAPSPEERFGSIDAFAAALAGRAPAASPARRATPAGRKLLIALGGLALVAGVSYTLLRPGTSPGLVDPYLIAGARIDATEPAAAAGLLERLAVELPGAPGPRLVALSTGDLGAAGRQARSRGAGQLLHGSATSTRSTLTVRLQLDDLIRGRILGQFSATASRDSLPALARELALGILRLEASRGDPAVLATLPHSLPALSAFASGMAHYRLARYPAAAEHFQHAIQADSSFALAGLWLTLTSLEYGGSDQAMAFTWARRAGLTPRDQAVFRALAGRDYPASRDLKSTLAELEEAVFTNDDRPELWTRLGTFLARYGSFLGVPDGGARAEGALLQALRYDPDRLAALERLVEVRGRLGDAAGLRTAARRFLAIDSTSELAPFVRWRLSLADQDEPTRRRLIGGMENWNGVSLHQLIWTTQLEGLSPDDALAASEALLRRSTSEERADRLITRHDLLANVGLAGEAAAALRQMREARPAWTGWQQMAVTDALFWDGDATLAAEALDSARAARGGTARDSLSRRTRRSAACVTGLWQAERGSADSAGRAALMLAEAEREAPQRSSTLPGCSEVIRTMLAVRAGAPDAHGRVDSLERVARTGQLLPGVGGATNLLLARLYHRLGDYAAARLAASRFWYWGRTLYVSPYHYQGGRSALEAHDSTAARGSLGRVATLWAGGDPAHRLRADSVRVLLAKLPP